jgi:hypothetical protein
MILAQSLDSPSILSSSLKADQVISYKYCNIPLTHIDKKAKDDRSNIADSKNMSFYYNACIY